MKTIPLPMPHVNPRRPYNDDQPDGYLESLNDWTQNNLYAIKWFLENHREIEKVLLSQMP